MGILITGSSGFLGSYLYKNITNENLISYNRSEPESTNWKNISGVIHCAGLAHVSHNPVFEKKFKESNIDLTIDLFEQFMNSNARFFIFFSTSKIYDNSFKDYVTESDVGNNLSIYAKSKLTAEEEISKYQNSKKIIILRPAVIIGPNPKGNIATLHKIIERKMPLILPQKSVKKNFTDIRNITFLIDLIIKNPNLLESGIYNIVDDKSLDIEEVLRSLAKEKKRPLRILLIPNNIFKYFLRLLQTIRPAFGIKLQSLLFQNLRISNDKIRSITNLPYNSFE